VTGALNSVVLDRLSGTGNRIVMADASGSLYATSSAAATGLPDGTTGQTLRHNGTSWIANSVLFNNGTNVGIGTTNPGNSRLSVAGIANGTDALVNIDNSTGTGRGLFINSNGTTNVGFIVQTPLSTSLTTGKVFSGMVAGDSYTRFMFYSDGKYGIGPGNADRDTFISRHAANTLKVSSDGGTGFGNLVVTGNVGVGTTNPQLNLDVNGSAIFSDIIYSSKISSSQSSTGRVNVDLGYFSISNKEKREIRIPAGGNSSDVINGLFKIRVVGDTGSVGTRSYIEKTIYISTYISPGYIYAQKSYVSDYMQSDFVRISDFFYDSNTDEIVLTLWWVSTSSRGYDVSIEYFGKNANKFLNATVSNPITYVAGEEPPKEIVSIAPDSDLYVPHSVGIGTANPGTRLSVVGDGNYSIDASSYKIGNVATPTVATDAANKDYVDSAIPTVPAQLWSGTLNGNIWNGTAGAGNVGIGVTSPTAKLDINIPAATGQAGLKIFKASDINQAALSVQHSTGVDTRKIAEFLNMNGTVMLIRGDGNVGIGTTTPGSKLHVVGNTELAGDVNITASSTLNMLGGNINAVNKLTVNTIDPLYNIKGVNYSTFAPSMVGGVKEEYVGFLEINKPLQNGEYEKIIDFDQVAEGSDLWVWHKTIDFSPNNVQVIITPIAQFANTYYFIEDNKLVLRADKEVEVSYRLTGNRHDWKEWPTRALDQTEKAGFIID
jgi:hypothetical protein